MSMETNADLIPKRARFWRCQSTHVMWGAPQRCWQMRWHVGPHQVEDQEFAPICAESDDGSVR